MTTTASGPLPVPRPRSTMPCVRTRVRRAALVWAFAAAFTACARNVPAGRIDPGVEQQLIESARPAAPRLVVFDWSLTEGQSRFSGAGAARIAPDYRARLDLFGPQDVPYLSAILREGRLVLPAGVPARVVPPAPLLWSAIGVIRPPDGAVLRTAQLDGADATLAYEADDGIWTFRARSGVLIGAEWQSSGGARHTVELDAVSAGSAPRRAVYRDWQEYRELELEIDQQEEVGAFPPETWSLEAR